MRLVVLTQKIILMKFKHHPIVKDLQVNEDGSQIFYQGHAISVNSYQNPRDNYPAKLVCFKGKTHRLTKIICETWNGLRPDQDMVVKRRDLNPDNYHYTNLYWANRGGMRTIKSRRSKKSKITVNDIATIIERIEAGETLHCIAKSYSTSDMSIYRIKKGYLTDKKYILKNNIMKAKDSYEKRFAFAIYLGFKSISEAISKYGKHQFLQRYKKELSW